MLHVYAQNLVRVFRKVQHDALKASFAGVTLKQLGTCLEFHVRDGPNLNVSMILYLELPIKDTIMDNGTSLHTHHGKQRNKGQIRIET